MATGDGNARLIFSAEDQTAAVFKALNANLGQLHTLGEKVKGTLEALGVTLSAGYFIDMVKGSIEAANHLGDLSKSTDITVEQLAGLKLLAQQSGTDLDGLAKGINRMTVEIGKAPDKFRALGVTAKDGVGALKQVADIFQRLPDITQRNAVAQAIFSKSWAEMAPILAEGGAHIEETIAKGERLSGMTADLAKQANEFNGKLAELTGTNGLLNRELVPLLPLLNELADEIINARDKTSDADHEFNALAETLKAIVVFGGNVAFTFRGIGREIGGLYAQLDALGIDLTTVAQGPAAIAAALAAAVVKGDASAARFKAIHEEMRADSEKDRAEFDAWKAKVMGVTAAMGAVADTSDAMSRRMQGAARADQAAAAARAAAFLAWQDATKKAEAEYDALIKRLDEKKQAEEEELKKGRQLTEAEKFEAKVLADLKTNKSVLTEAQKEAIKVRLAETMAIARQNEEHRKEIAGYIAGAQARAEDRAAMAADLAARDMAFKAALTSINDQTQALKDSNAQLKLEGTLVAGTDAQRATAIGQLQVQQKLERDLKALDDDRMIDEEKRVGLRQKLYDNAAAEKQLVADRAAFDQFARGWDTVDQEAKATWDSMQQGGDAAFKHLGQTLKQSLWDLLYQMTIKQWVFQIYANVTGGPAGLAGMVNGVAGSAGSSFVGGSIGNMLSSGATSLLGSGSFLGNMFAGATGVGGSFASSVGAGLATDAMGATVSEGAAAATLGGASSLGAGLMAAAPYLAIGALVVSSLLKSGGGPKVDGQFNPFTRDTMGVGNSANQSQSSVAAAAAQVIQAQYNSLVSQLGGTGGLKFGVGLSTDPKGTAPSMVQIAAGAGGTRQFESVNLNVGRSDQELQAAITAQTTDVLIKALRASNLDKPFADFFNGIADDASQETKQAAVKVASDVAAYTGQIRGLGGVFSQLTDLSVETRGALINAAGGLQALSQATTSYFDNFYTQAEKRQITAANIAATLSGAGLNVTTDQVLSATREQFRALVDSLNLTTDTGRRGYVALMNVSSAFAGITQPIQDTTAALTQSTQAVQNLGQSLQQQLDGAVSSWLSGQELRDYRISQIQRALIGTDLSFTAEQIGNATRDQIKDLFKYLLAIGDTKAAEAMLSVSSALLEITQPAEDATKSLQAAAKALQDAGKGVHDFIQQLITTRAGTASPQELLANTRSDYLSDLSKARMGDLAATQHISTSAQAYIDAQKAYTASGGNTQAVISQVIGELQSLPATKSYEQQSLDSLSGILDALEALPSNLTTVLSPELASLIADKFKSIDLNGNGITFDELQRALAGKATDEQLHAIFNALDTNGDGTISMLEALSGKADTANLTSQQVLNRLLQDSMLSFPAAAAGKVFNDIAVNTGLAANYLAAISGTLAPGVTASIAAAATGSTTTSTASAAASSDLKAYTTGGASDADKLAAETAAYYAAKSSGQHLYAAAAAAGYSASDVDQFLAATGLPSFDVGINRVPRDMLALIHRDEAVVPARYNPAAGGFGSDETAREVRELKATVRELMQRLIAVSAEGHRTQIGVQKETVEATRSLKEGSLAERARIPVKALA